MGIIGSIRKHSWIAVAVVGVAIVAFIIGDLTKNNNKMPDLGRIGGTTITYQRFNNMVTEAEENIKRQQGVAQLTSDEQARVREQVWQNLVNETLIEKEFERLGLVVSDAEMTDMFLGTFIHPYLRQAFTNPQTGVYPTDLVHSYIENFDKLDTAQRREWVEMEKYVRTDRGQQKYSALIVRGLYMPTALAEQVAAFSSEVKNVNIISLPYQSVNEEEVVLTDEDYQKYYDAHRNEFRIREELRDIDYIVFPIVPTAQDLANIQAEVEKVWAEFQEQGDDELAFFVNAESDRSYDSSFRHAEDFTAPMDSAIRNTPAGSFISPRIVGNEWHMAKVVKIENRPDSLRASIIYILNDRASESINRGDEQARLLADSVKNIVASGAMSIEEAVNQFSDDPQKANNKGDMDWQLDGNYGFLNEKIIETPEGGVFVIQHPSEIGYCVVKVTGKTTPHRKYRVADIVRFINASDATGRAVLNDANKFAGNNQTYAAMISAAQAENLQVRSGRVNAMSYNLGGLRNPRLIIQWAFEEKTKVGDVADKVFDNDDHDQYIVAALKDIYKVGYATLEQVRPMIENQVRIEKKAEMLKQRAKEALEGTTDMAVVAGKLSATVDTLDSVAFNDYYLGKYGMEPKVQAAIAAIEGSAIVGPIQGANGVYLVKVASKATNPNPVDPAAIRSQVQQLYQQKMYALQQVLKDNTKIVDHRNKYF